MLFEKVLPAFDGFGQFALRLNDPVCSCCGLVLLLCSPNSLVHLSRLLLTIVNCPPSAYR